MNADERCSLSQGSRAYHKLKIKAMASIASSRQQLVGGEQGEPQALGGPVATRLYTLALR